ncbi:hypothetical protein [Cellulosilyticum sp. I15G10I2]|uniref:hypothetical protein n=1 Tax=Cellulosilyticum sp. I15G10I2 TaxID=1892843 RepID=UPI00085CCC6C|nr:hypothetical protein [Cellulosilyticum sp. I15G10I2]
MSTKHLKYCPELNTLIGSVNATIVLLQLEYWFTKMAADRFYKFLDACSHELYMPGDSWVEELGFSKNEFRTAFSKIGKVYQSKKAFQASKDLFSGKYYASYYDRRRGLTYYIRNNAKLDVLFKNTSTKNSASDNKTTESKKPALQKTKDETSANPETSSPLSVNNNKLLTSVKNTYIPNPNVPYDTIKDLFNSFCPSFPSLTLLTDKRKAMLKKLWYSLGQTLDHFKKAFTLAENSDFLSGRIGSWRASFDWLIQEDKFVALLEGCYTNLHAKTQCLTAPTPNVSKPNQKFTTMYSHNWDFEALEKLEMQHIDTQLAMMGF